MKIFRRILVPVDGSTASLHAGKVALALAQSLGCQVVGLFVVPALQYPIYAQTTPPYCITGEEYLASMQTTARTFLNGLEKMAEDCRVEFQRELRTGQSVARAIVDAATDLRCDLVFIASQGMAGADETALGSVTAKVLALSPVPVLVYRGRLDVPEVGPVTANP